ncbi:MAG: hypothetical protein WCF65_04520 [Parachlamydiaceae bacterium]
MDIKECLTNEKIRKKFVNQFDLVNYAIRLAENMIITGRDPRVKIDSQNRALQVLSEILNNKDKFDDVFVEPEVVGYSTSTTVNHHEEPPLEKMASKSYTSKSSASKSYERKKTGKAVAK